MNNRQKLIIQLGCDYVAATINKKDFDILTTDPAKLTRACFMLAEAVADNVRDAVRRNQSADDPDAGPVDPAQPHYH